MKVYIGPYKTFWGTYQIAELLRYAGVPKPRREKIGDWLGNTWVDTVCQWFYAKYGSQKIKVKVDQWDTWGMDSTLGYIVLPMLKQLQATKHGAPQVDYKDVPTHLRPNQIEIEKYNKQGETDAKFFERWDWVMNEMIFAFESQNNDWEDQYRSGIIDFVSVPIDVNGNAVAEEEAQYFRMDRGPNDTYEVDYEGMKVYQARIDNGFRLFGVYFRSLWD